MHGCATRIAITPATRDGREIVAVAASGTSLSSSVPATDRSDELNNYPTDLLNSPPQCWKLRLKVHHPLP